MLRLERDALSTVECPRQATSEYPPPVPVPFPSSRSCSPTLTQVAHEVPRRVFRKPPLLPYQRPQVPPRAVLQDEIDMSFRFLGKEKKQEQKGTNGLQ